MKKVIFEGAGVAIVTPFTADGKVNYQVLEKLINRQIENETDAIVICATTGENSTLSDEEHEKTIKFAVDCVAGRVPVVASSGSNDTEYALNLSKEAEAAGADALLMVTPYYNKTSQDGLVRHFHYIADRVSLPIIVYNVPSRTGLNILPETYYKLSRHPRIVATKEANGDIAALAHTISLCGDDLDVYSGNDDQIAAFVALGAKGVISVISNVIPKVAHDMAIKGVKGDIAASTKLQLEYFQLCHDLFIDVNPIPVKEALNMMGLDVGECRMPLAPMSDEKKEILSKTLKKYNLI
ncbi:MAG TPA: 4-hydroxy-tetrahydrodipicolinate synthase [Clostridia bacterium]|nr:4-hydroxy-tetrahydrodipicolinate synthase [Clostridia bacterium]